MGDTEILIEPAGAGAGAPAARPWRRRAVLAVRVVGGLAIGYFVVATTIAQWSAVRATFRELSWPIVGLSLVAALLSIGANVFAWRDALGDLGHRVRPTSAGQVFLVGQLGKYLPGSVWSYVLQMELGRRAGVPRARALLASLTTAGLGTTVGLVLGTIGLRATLEAARGSEHEATARVAFVVTLVLLPIALVCAHPRVLTRVVQLLLRVLRRRPLDSPLTWAGTLRVSAWAAVGYVFLGLHLWLLARTQAAPGWSGLVLCIGAFGLAIAVSTFVIIAPSGIGVREFLIAITLAGFGVSFGTSYAIALASRLIVTVADVLAAGIAAATGVRRVHRAQSTAGPAD